MKELHPNFLKALLRQVPEGVDFVEIRQGDNSNSILTTSAGGEVEVQKIDIGVYFDANEITVKAEKGWDVIPTMEAISRRHGLYLVVGVDYDAASCVVDGDKLVWKVPKTSYIWKGEMTFRIVTTARGTAHPIAIPLKRARIQALFLQEIITGKGKLLTDRKVLNTAIVKALHARLVDDGITSLAFDKLQKAELVKVFSDAFSSVAAINVENYGSLFFRFDYEKDNPKEPDPS